MGTARGPGRTRADNLPINVLGAFNLPRDSFLSSLADRQRWFALARSLIDRDRAQHREPNLKVFGFVRPT